MIDKSNLIRGSVAIVTCQDCQKSLPLFEFEFESDTDIVGFCSAAKCNSTSLVIAEVTVDEWKAMEAGELSTLPARFESFREFNVLYVKRIERSPDPPEGISFQEYRKIYRPPVVVYACPCCKSGEAFKTRELTVAEFEGSGGQIIALGNLVVEY